MEPQKNYEFVLGHKKRLNWAYLSVNMYTIIHEKLTRMTCTQLDLLWFQLGEEINSDSNSNLTLS